MRVHSNPLWSALVCAALTGCAGSLEPGFAGGIHPDHGIDRVRRTGSARVLAREEIGDHGMVLDALARSIPGVRAHRLSSCPQIELRGRSSLTTPTNPLVYVDGTRTGDTCILSTLRAEDVQRVEVYPNGVSPRPGYSTHHGGLVLIFTRQD